MSRADASVLPPALVPPATASRDGRQELRVRLPAHVHRQLLALKILRGATLAETVMLALDHYFAEALPTPPSQLGAAAKAR